MISPCILVFSFLRSLSLPFLLPQPTPYLFAEHLLRPTSADAVRRQSQSLPVGLPTQAETNVHGQEG